jgi:hypothetical protein
MYNLHYNSLVQLKRDWRRDFPEEVCRIELVEVNVDSSEYQSAYFNCYEFPKVYFTKQVLPNLILKCKEKEDAYYLGNNIDTTDDDVSINELNYDTD